jgi:hypothetical protein
MTFCKSLIDSFHIASQKYVNTGTKMTLKHKSATYRFCSKSELICFHPQYENCVGSLDLNTTPHFYLCDEWVNNYYQCPICLFRINCLSFQTVVNRNKSDTSVHDPPVIILRYIGCRPYTNSVTTLYKLKLNSMVWVRERTIPTERPPLVGEVIANLCG